MEKSKLHDLKKTMEEFQSGIDELSKLDDNFDNLSVWYFITTMEKYTNRIKKNCRDKIAKIINDTENKNYRLTKDDLNLFAYFSSRDMTIFNLPETVENKIKALKEEFKTKKTNYTPQVELTFKS